MERVVVSVVIPVYNAQSTLDACLESVLGQSHDALEVLCVDDGSADGSLAVLRGYERRDPRVRVFSTPNGGAAHARNVALEAATGEYVQFVDSDDQLRPGAVERMLAGLHTRGRDLVIATYVEVIGSSRKTRGFIREDRTLTQAELLDRLSKHPNSFYFDVLWNKLYRRELIQRHGVRFDESLPWGEDFAFNTLYFAAAHEIEAQAEPVYDYHRGFGGLTTGYLRLCLRRPLFSIGVKRRLMRLYRELYRQTGLYARYRRVLPRYLYKFTLNN